LTDTIIKVFHAIQTYIIILELRFFKINRMLSTIKKRGKSVDKSRYLPDAFPYTLDIVNFFNTLKPAKSLDLWGF